MNKSTNKDNQFDKLTCQCGWVGYRIRTAKVRNNGITKEACPMCLKHSLKLEKAA